MTYAEYNPDLTFYFTKIGLGIAGYQLEDIAEIVMLVWINEEFYKRYIPSNVILPKEFVEFAEKFVK